MQRSGIRGLHGVLHGRGDCREQSVERSLSMSRPRCSTYHLRRTLVGVDRHRDEVMNGVRPLEQRNL